MIVIDRPWTRQPPAPTLIDRGNPLAAGLVAAIVPAWPNPGYTLVGSPGANRRPIDAGIAHSGNGASMWTGTITALGSAATLMIVGNFRTNATAGFTAGFGTNTAGSQLFALQNSSSGGGTTPRAVLRCVDAGGITTAEFNTLNTNTAEITSIESIAAVYDGTSALKVYRNGHDVTSGNLNTAASGAMTSMNNVSLGGINRGTDGFAQSGQLTALVLGWNRALSSSELSQIDANPWQLFEPRHLYIPYAVASTIPTLSASTYVAGSLTSTGWRPQVTAT